MDVITICSDLGAQKNEVCKSQTRLSDFTFPFHFHAIKIFSYNSSVYSCHFFLISSAYIKSIPFLSFIETILAWNVPLVSLISLKRSLVFPLLLFSSISLHWLLRKAFLSLLAILWNSAFRCLFFLFSFVFHFSSFHSCF